MMGLLAKSGREGRAIVLILGPALLVVETILSYVLPTFLDEFSAQLLQVPFIRSMISALLGTDIGAMISPDAIIAITWVHPVVLAIMWTQAVVFCTRMPAGEIDRGTIDILLGLPVSRWGLYVAETVILAGIGVVLVLMGLVGHRLGLLVARPPQTPGLGRVLTVAMNMYCLYLAVGGLSLLVSAFSDRRGRAMAIVFGLLLASFLLNFLAQFWEPADAVSFLSLLNYYRPLPMLQDGAAGLPVADMVVLLGFAAVTWVAGGIWLARRDICTV